MFKTLFYFTKTIRLGIRKRIDCPLVFRFCSFPFLSRRWTAGEQEVSSSINCLLWSDLPCLNCLDLNLNCLVRPTLPPITSFIPHLSQFSSENTLLCSESTVCLFSSFLLHFLFFVDCRFVGRVYRAGGSKKGRFVIQAEPANKYQEHTPLLCHHLYSCCTVDPDF